MNPALATIALVTVGGAILAVCARDVRATVLGLLVVLLSAPLIADPWPGPLAILVRIAAGLLAVRLVTITVRGDIATSGSRIGWPAEVLLAASAMVIGFGSHGLGSAGLGPAEAQAAGFALIVLAVAPLFTGRDALRVAVGAVLLLVAASLVRGGLDRAPSDAEHLVTSVLTIALGGAVAVIVAAARAAGGLQAIDAGGLGGAGRRLPDAHRATPGESRQARNAAAGPRPAAGAAARRSPVADVPARQGPVADDATRRGAVADDATRRGTRADVPRRREPAPGRRPRRGPDDGRREPGDPS